eukprot:m.191963 g.191963  ORF g.191963 m.191963 type:complete len:342 (+) comp25727_c1_seq4:428-1453(+)
MQQFVAALLVALLVYYFSVKTMSWAPVPEKSMKGRVALVTGANTGVGFETALHLAKLGTHVVLACRNLAKAEQARQRILTEVKEAPSVDVMVLDLSQLSSVREFVKQFLARDLPLHVLINNAGLNAPINTKTIDGFEVVYGVNFLGHFLLTMLLLPKLKQSGTIDAPARVVCLSSVMHHLGKLEFENVLRETRLDSYSTSKLALHLLADELQWRLRDDGRIRFVAVNPGAVDSDIWRSVNFCQRFFAAIRSLVFLTPEQGSRPSVHAAVARLPEIKYTAKTSCVPYFSPYFVISGLWLPMEFLGPFAGCLETPPASTTYDRAAGARLIQVSADACGLEGEE